MASSTAPQTTQILVGMLTHVLICFFFLFGSVQYFIDFLHPFNFYTNGIFLIIKWWIHGGFKRDQVYNCGRRRNTWRLVQSERLCSLTNKTPGGAHLLAALCQKAVVYRACRHTRAMAA
ncbi:hypothetical protein BDZ91DRAFT_720833 [Kalaharituber pfeilii]|nr:hypothetical protein BDZ91DRAFT_720833 [Kalaharituber pfeilii]